MTRLAYSLFLIASLSAAVSSESASAKAPLNVLFVVADDLRDHLGCYGNKTVHTPNIDRLAARGVRFDHAYAQYPVCNPSRSSFLTGLWPDQTGVTDNATLLRSKLPGVVTMPQLFRKNGYYTAAFGKIFHLGGGRNAAAHERWMDLPKSWDEAHAYRATAAGTILEGRNLTNGKLAWCRWGMTAGADDDQPDGQNALQAITLIEKLGDKPWFIGLGFHKPHDPFVAPKKYFDQYPPGSIALYRDPPDLTPAPPLAVGFGEFGAAFTKFTDTERLEYQRAYYAGISFIDAQLGRVLDALDRLRFTERTLIVFLSDHGYHLGERQWWNKNTLFERSTRTPLIIAAPGGTPGVARGLVELVDLFPTIAGVCGLQPPEGLAGQDLQPLLNNPSLPGKAAAFTIVTRGAQQRGDSIRTDRWRYTEWSDGLRELYDHVADPEETKNALDSNPHIAKTLSQQLQAMKQKKFP
jgi:uncharacterized sulfatase